MGLGACQVSELWLENQYWDEAALWQRAGHSLPTSHNWPSIFAFGLSHCHISYSIYIVAGILIICGDWFPTIHVAFSSLDQSWPSSACMPLPWTDYIMCSSHLWNFHIYVFPPLLFFIPFKQLIPLSSSISTLPLPPADKLLIFFSAFDFFQSWAGAKCCELVGS